MVGTLNLPHEQSNSHAFEQRLHALREQVDGLDNRLLDLLAQRMEVVRRMGEIKAEQNVSTFQPGRWQEIVDDRIRKGSGLSLSEDFVMQLMQSIHEEAIRQQEVRRVKNAG